MDSAIQLNEQALVQAQHLAKERGQSVAAVVEYAISQLFAYSKNEPVPTAPKKQEPATWYDPDKLLESEKLALGLIEPSREHDNLYDALMAWREKYVDEDWDFDPDEVFNNIRKEYIDRDIVVFE